MGNISPLVLCRYVSNMVQFIDPDTLQVGDLMATNYWRTPFAPLCSYRDLVQYYVLDVEPTGQRNGKVRFVTRLASSLWNVIKLIVSFTCVVHVGQCGGGENVRFWSK